MILIRLVRGFFIYYTRHLDLRWHQFLVGHKLRKDCPHKEKWQCIQCEIEQGIYFICAGCLKTYFIGKDGKRYKNVEHYLKATEEKGE
jgi:hypothetical protein